MDQRAARWMNHSLFFPACPFCIFFLSSIHCSWCTLSVLLFVCPILLICFTLFFFPSFLSSCPLPLPLFSPWSESVHPPSAYLSIPTVALLNKCISHMVELIRRSFSSAPYGPTVKLHKVFKVTASQQISAYCSRPSFLVLRLFRLCLTVTLLSLTHALELFHTSVNTSDLHETLLRHPKSAYKLAIVWWQEYVLHTPHSAYSLDLLSYCVCMRWYVTDVTFAKPGW